MSLPSRPSLPTALVLALLTVGLAGCSGISNPFSTSEAPPPAPELTPTCRRPYRRRISSGAGPCRYHKDEDRARTEAAAANQCKQPYIITLARAAAS